MMEKSEEPYKNSIVLKALYDHGKEATIPELVKMTNLTRDEVKDAVDMLRLKHKFLISRREYIVNKKFLLNEGNVPVSSTWSHYRLNDKKTDEILRWVNNVGYIKKEPKNIDDNKFLIVLETLYNSGKELTIKDLTRMTNLTRVQVINIMRYIRIRYRVLSKRKEFISRGQMYPLHKTYYKIKNPRRALSVINNRYGKSKLFT